MDMNIARETFLNSAVRVVAREGIEKATTKAIAAEAKLNEAYIYKCFSSKDEMMAEALRIKDERLAKVLHEALPVMYQSDMPWHDRAFALFCRCWEYILADRVDCAFYIRYYYSTTGLGSNYATHLESYESLIRSLGSAFEPGTRMDVLIHQIFSTMLFFASWVIDGKLDDDDKTRDKAFEQIYSFIVPNVRKELLLEGQGA